MVNFSTQRDCLRKSQISVQKPWLNLWETFWEQDNEWMSEKDYEREREKGCKRDKEIKRMKRIKIVPV